MSPKDRKIETAGAKPLAQNPFAALAHLLAPARETPSEAASVPPAPARTEPAPEPKKGAKGRLVLHRETKHRGGKTVVVIRGFEALTSVGEPELVAIASELKRSLGCGGTVEQGEHGRVIIIQGDHPGKVAEHLRKRGFRVDGVTS